jgi:hypothetical protein
MKTSIYVLLTLVAVGFLAMVSAEAEEPSSMNTQGIAGTVQNDTRITDVAIVRTPITGCNTDFAEHCKGIPAEGNQRLNCLMEHEKDLEPKCKQGILMASLQSQLGINKLDYAYQSCKSERLGICGNVAAGEGRLLKCFKDNQSQVSADCISALKNTGFWDAALEPASGE